MVAGTAYEFDFQKYAAHRRGLIDERLAEWLSDREPALLFDAMRYSVLSAGKRIRALLCLASAEALQEASPLKLDPVQTALPLACAIELIHAMSLIHDDLPCMDNDDFRRGKPTNHKVYGEAMALLAGDALLTLATEILIRKTDPRVSPSILLKVTAELSSAAGAQGMVGGQVEDLISTGQVEDKSCLSSAYQDQMQLLESIHKRKTGALLSFSTSSGAALMGADERILKALNEFGEILGLAFQIADDLLDVTGDIKTIGKTPGKDAATGKLTWVAVHGMERSKEALLELEKKGKQLLRQTELGDRSIAPLSALLEYSVHRTN